MHAANIPDLTEHLGTLDKLLEGISFALQLSPTQYKRAEERYRPIGSWLEGADEGLLSGARLSIYGQGSFQIGTTVRPIQRAEFDLDIVAEICRDPGSVYPAIALLDAVDLRLRQSPHYADMLERKNRCIRVRYADDFHLDILPACPDPSRANGCLVVPDTKLSNWTPSNPKGFAAWFESRCTVVRLDSMGKAMAPLPAQVPSPMKPALKKVVQLMKRHRDIEFRGREKQAPVSIVLTTLAGTYYPACDSIIDALEAVLLAIAAKLLEPEKLRVYNPTNDKELLSERWDEAPNTYEDFKTWVFGFIAKLRVLRGTSGLHNVIRLLSEMFGDQPAEAARKAMVDGVEAHRHDGHPATQASGLLVVGAPATVPVVQRNTFFGA